MKSAYKQTRSATHNKRIEKIKSTNQMCYVRLWTKARLFLRNRPKFIHLVCPPFDMDSLAWTQQQQQQQHLTIWIIIKQTKTFIIIIIMIMIIERVIIINSCHVMCNNHESIARVSSCFGQSSLFCFQSCCCCSLSWRRWDTNNSLLPI